MERPQKTIKLPGGQTVVMKTYLTAREVLGVAKETEDTDAKKVTNFERAAQLLSLAVISIDDAKENLSEYAQDLPVQDYTALVTEVTNLVQGFTKAE